MDAIWRQTVEFPRFEKLNGDLTTDVLIIGGGITGILCAHMLSRAGVDYALVEADRLCGGISQNTTAKITFQHGLIYSKLIRRFGAEMAAGYFKTNQWALEQYRTMCREIDCDFEQRDLFVYSLNDPQKIVDEVAALKKLGVEAEFAKELPLAFPVAGAIKIERQAQFHPLKFLAAVAKNLRIFEKTKVLELMPGKAVTTGGVVAAKKIIIATHFPILNKHGGYFLKLYQHRSYVLALKGAAKLNEMYVDESESGMSFRGYADMLLLGGGGHRTGKKGGGWQELEVFADRYYPKAREVGRWATQDCMPLDNIPYIGQYAKSTPDLFTATGFQKWGMTSAMAAAGLLCDLVQGKKNPYTEVFSPSRTVFYPQLAMNVAESVVNLLTPVVPRCPHMGCALKYNAQEHSWDCPCHGSRFEEDGSLIDNPATDDMSLKSLFSLRKKGK